MQLLNEMTKKRKKEVEEIFVIGTRHFHRNTFRSFFKYLQQMLCKCFYYSNSNLHHGFYQKLQTFNNSQIWLTQLLSNQANLKGNEAIKIFSTNLRNGANIYIASSCRKSTFNVANDNLTTNSNSINFLSNVTA